MKVRRLSDCIGNEREVSGKTWTSRRLVLADDGVGFSFHDTVLRAGTVTEMWYKHHIESVYCISGSGSILDMATNERHSIEAGTLYLLDENDRHQLTATTELRMMCVFNPAITGDEVHDEDGAYRASTAGAPVPGNS